MNDTRREAIERDIQGRRALERRQSPDFAAKLADELHRDMGERLTAGIMGVLDLLAGMQQNSAGTDTTAVTTAVQQAVTEELAQVRRELGELRSLIDEVRAGIQRIDRFTMQRLLGLYNDETARAGAKVNQADETAEADEVVTRACSARTADAAGTVGTRRTFEAARGVEAVGAGRAEATGADGTAGTAPASKAVAKSSADDTPDLGRAPRMQVVEQVLTTARRLQETGRDITQMTATALAREAGVKPAQFTYAFKNRETFFLQYHQWLANQQMDPTANQFNKAV